MKYNVVITTSASGTVEVEADSPEEAADLVRNGDIDFPTLCAQCSGWGQKYLEIGDEWDVVTEENGKPAVYEAED